MKATPKTNFDLVRGLLCALAICASGQSTPEKMSPLFRGDSTLALGVEDQQRARIPSAAILIEQDATGLKVEGKTDNAGVYHMTDLAAGRYSIKVDAWGFRQEAFVLRLGPGENLSWTVTLRTAGESSYDPIAETPLAAQPIVSSVNPDYLQSPEILQLPMGGGPMPMIPLRTNPAPKHSRIKHFFSTLGRKLGF